MQEPLVVGCVPHCVRSARRVSTYLNDVGSLDLYQKIDHAALNDAALSLDLTKALGILRHHIGLSAEFLVRERAGRKSRSL